MPEEKLSQTDFFNLVEETSPKPIPKDETIPDKKPLKQLKLEEPTVKHALPKQGTEEFSKELAKTTKEKYSSNYWER